MTGKGRCSATPPASSLQLTQSKAAWKALSSVGIVNSVTAPCVKALQEYQYGPDKIPTMELGLNTIPGMALGT